MIPIENKGTSPLHVGSFVVLPGETRLLAARDVPPHLHPKPVIESAAPVADEVAKLSGLTVNEINVALLSLTGGELTRLANMENEKAKPRAGVVEAIVKERLRRADAAEKLQEFNAAVAKMDDAALRDYRANMLSHPELVAAIDAELQARTPAPTGD